MTANEIATLIGELFVMEIDDVHRVEYTVEKTDKSAFTVVMENGKRFYVEISTVKNIL